MRKARKRAIMGLMKRLLALVLLVGGCSAQMVSAPGSASGSAFAPTNEKTRPGVVKYVNDGAESVRKSRREDAYKQMYTACNGPYRIDSEGQQLEGGYVIAATTDVSTAFPQHFWYIQFSCEPKTTASR